MVKRWFQAMGDGLLLRCPACRQGRMGKSLTELHHKCANCGITFEPNEGDFIGAMMITYSVLAVFLCFGIFLLIWLTDLSAVAHIIIWSLFSIAFILLGYRNMKGLWVGILYAMTGLKRLY
jgi:uncharacterized protein (DUF983 family)